MAQDGSARVELRPLGGSWWGRSWAHFDGGTMELERVGYSGAMGVSWGGVLLG